MYTLPNTIWERGEIMLNKIEYIHHNPIKRGYIEEDWHWRYSSARDYNRHSHPKSPSKPQQGLDRIRLKSY